MNLKFQGTFKIKADLTCITGLHIGGSKETFEIGGIDNPVIKTPISIKLNDNREIKEGMPYIPGSSLKGKIRSLLEWQYGLVKAKVEEKNGKVEVKSEFIPNDETQKNLNDVAIVFGVGASMPEDYKHLAPQPVRIKVFDAYPTSETIRKWEEELGAGLYTEVKWENKIDRITSTAMPRQQERVPAGSSFEVEILYEVFEEKDYERLKIVFEGMKRLEDNYLGGGGSRGNGRVKFENIKIQFKGKDVYLNPEKQVKEESFQDVNEVLRDFEKVKKLAKGD
ncbi:MAG: type III-A CRISPR-associated RAMP protein Csm3 [Hydrogenothermus sp.]|nr:MAG: type III-A CRISPR-associated RAMP protein Csm3 [Hydrogenothermus sp.]